MRRRRAKLRVATLPMGKNRGAAQPATPVIQPLTTTVDTAMAPATAIVDMSQALGRSVTRYPLGRRSWQVKTSFVSRVIGRLGQASTAVAANALMWEPPSDEYTVIGPTMSRGCFFSPSGRAQAAAASCWNACCVSLTEACGFAIVAASGGGTLRRCRSRPARRPSSQG